MQNDFSQFANDASNANKALFETVGRLNETNAQTFEKLTSVQMEIANLLFEGSTKQLQAWGNARDYSEILAAQSSLSEEYGRKFMDCAQQTLDVVTGQRDAYTSLMEQNIEKATENFKRAAPTRAA
ncbi:MAG: phasin family protein [Gammaproteobacteria bacterium]